MAEAEQQKEAAAAEAEVSELSLLDQIVEEGRFGREDEAQQQGRQMIKAFVNDVLEGAITYSEDTEAMLTSQIAEIDQFGQTNLSADRAVLGQPPQS